MQVSTNSVLYTGSYDRTLRSWDVATGECLKIFKAHHDCVYTLLVQ